MSKIDPAGARPSQPVSNPESAENIKQTSAAGESTRAESNSAAAESTSSPARITADKNPLGELKATGGFIKAALQKALELQNAQGSDSDQEMAKKASETIQRFAPPYVPVGSVPPIDAPLPPTAGQINELRLKPDQFQINDQGNLVITNQQLIEFFKELKETQSGQDIRLGFVKMKPPGEE